VETEEEPETFTDEYGNVYSSADAYKNFRKGERPEDDPDGNPEDTTNGGSNPNGSSQKGKLPQTGQMWWPIPVLLSCGFVLLLVGYGIGGGEDEEA
jgi:hypothetical protein